MRKMLSEIDRLSKQGECFVFASILEHSGSTPRSSGARMLIRQDKSIFGTIGGGLLEARVRELAQSIFITRQPREEQITFTGEDAAQSDMICGGEVKVLLEWVDSKNIVDWTTFKAMKQDMDAQGSSYIFGAGHVSQALAVLTNMVGFYTVVVDDRAEYANRDRFPLVDEIRVANPIESVFDAIPIGENSYIVIVTRGHLQDREVLERALQTPAKYIGMIGSKTKCELIYKYLQKKGWSDTDFSRINAPIGIRIKSETPEEIAVSIVAEMILKRAATVKA